MPRPDRTNPPVETQRPDFGLSRLQLEPLQHRLVEPEILQVGKGHRLLRLLPDLVHLTLQSEEVGLRGDRLVAHVAHIPDAAAHVRRAETGEAQDQKAEARIRLIRSRIDQARLVAPIDGWVVSEDRKQKIGAPVATGDILFEIAGIDSLRAELYVPETTISDVVAGQSGWIAAVGHPDQKIGFVIERIHPIAEELGGEMLTACEPVDVSTAALNPAPARWAIMRSAMVSPTSAVRDGAISAMAPWPKKRWNRLSPQKRTFPIPSG